MYPEGEAAELTYIGLSPSILGTAAMASRLGVCGASQRSAVRAAVVLDTRTSTFAHFLITADGGVFRRSIYGIDWGILPAVLHCLVLQDWESNR